MAAGEYILNRKEGRDTIHDPSRLTESCNTDQIESRAKVDEFTAEAMMIRGDAVPCKHCMKDADDPVREGG